MTDDADMKGRGRLIAEGGRLIWIDPRLADENGADDDDSPAHGSVLDALTEDDWSSDTLVLPPGAPDSARVRAAQAWVERHILVEQQRLNEATLSEREAQQAYDASLPPHRRRRPGPPLPEALATAAQQGVLDALDAAGRELRDLTDRGIGRILVEWYLWLEQESQHATDDDDPFVRARADGYQQALRVVQRHTERLTLPEIDDDEA